MKTLLVLTSLLIFISCQKEISGYTTSSQGSDSSLFIGDSIWFSPHIKPVGWRTDTAQHYFIGDSFYVAADSCKVKRVFFSIANANGTTHNVRMLIDDKRQGKIDNPSIDFLGRCICDFDDSFILYKGWHFIMFRGDNTIFDSNPNDTIYPNIIYSLEKFVAILPTRETVPVKGLPLQMKRHFAPK